MDIVFGLLVVTVLTHGIIAGISLDTALVKLPTRKRIGALAYANFTCNSDLGNGLIVYPSLGVLVLVLIFTTTIVGYMVRAPYAITLSMLVASATTIAHSLCTAKAAPIVHSLKHTPDNEQILAEKLNQFAFWNALRATFQFLTFVVVVWALIAAVPLR